MTGFREGLRMRQLEDRLKEAASTERELVADMKLLVEAVCGSQEFGDWLLEQDVSSSHWTRPSGGPGRHVEVEGRSDATLALAYAEWRKTNPK